jgi:hypothetical protein
MDLTLNPGRRRMARHSHEAGQSRIPTEPRRRGQPCDARRFALPHMARAS